MDDQERIVSSVESEQPQPQVEPQQPQVPVQTPAPTQAPVVNVQDPVTMQWQSKATYEASASFLGYDAQLLKTKQLGHLIDVLIAVAVCLVLLLSFIPDLPSYNSDPGNYRSMPATPIIGMAYLALDGLVIFRIVLARRKNVIKNRKDALTKPPSPVKQEKKAISVVLSVLVAFVGIVLAGPVVLIVPALIIAPVLCNFSSCSGT